ncbi:MAG: hypothetical protein QOD99_1898 [Chthoniobacter sp.]|jgi:hypothetical protein|nr:hypothetical protein [Chthoniobacter sp.]
MRLFVSLFLAVAVALSGAQSATAKDQKKTKKAKKGDSGEAGAPKFNLPIPIGHSAEGVTLPYFDDRGKMQMNFKIESATRTDNDHLEMAKAEVETFDANGKSEMRVQMARSILDLNTKIVTSESPVEIRRADFDVVGERMRFNMETRSGVMNGRVRMLIYNRSDMSAQPKHE